MGLSLAARLRASVVLLLAVQAHAALAQSSTITTVNGLSITVVSDGSQSVEATDDGARVLLDGEEVLIGPGTVSAGGITSTLDPFTEVLVESLGGTLRVEADGEQVFEITRGGGADPTALEADAGDLAGQTEIAGLLFDSGTEVDVARAADLLRGAAEAGHVPAQSNLAARLWLGEGLAQDREEALAWATRAAEGGDGNNLGKMANALLRGDGMPADAARGLALLEAAAATGDGNALNNLGLAYEAGVGVAADLARAGGYYVQAAEAGETAAFRNVGVAHVNSGAAAVPRDVALRWTQAAVDAGVEGAGPVLDAILALPETAPEAAPEPAAETSAPPPIPAADAARFFWADGQTPAGPLTLAELRALVADGTLRSDTLVWEEGMEAWAPAADLPALAGP